MLAASGGFWQATFLIMASASEGNITYDNYIFVCSDCSMSAWQNLIRFEQIEFQEIPKVSVAQLSHDGWTKETLLCIFLQNKTKRPPVLQEELSQVLKDLIQLRKRNPKAILHQGNQLNPIQSLKNNEMQQQMCLLLPDTKRHCETCVS